MDRNEQGYQSDRIRDWVVYLKSHLNFLSSCVRKLLTHEIRDVVDSERIKEQLHSSILN